MKAKLEENWVVTPQLEGHDPQLGKPVEVIDGKNT